MAAEEKDYSNFIVKSVGIDAIEVYIPYLKFSLFDEQFCKTRKRANEGIDDFRKRIESIGVLEMRMPDYNQDAAVMAANAVYNLVEKNHYPVEDITAIPVASETINIDGSKPIGTSIIGMLEQAYGKQNLSHIITYDAKFACVPASYLLRNAVNNLKCTDEDNIEIIVTTDIALYEKNDPGEITQGSGAVAFAVKKNPRMLDLKYISSVFGNYTVDVYDFYKPAGSITPVVDGKYSIDCYLNAMKAAYDKTREQLKKHYPEVDGRPLTDIFDYLVFHIPFPNMAKKAGASLLIHEIRNKEMMKEITEKIGPEPPKEADEYNKWLKDVMKTKMFQKFWEKIEPSVEASKHIGNIYTGSLFLGLVSLLDQSYNKGNDLAGKKIAFGGYGSGAAACAYFGIAQPAWKDTISHDLQRHIENALSISYDDYEKLHSWHTAHVSLDKEIEIKGVVEDIASIGKGPIDKGPFYLKKIDRGKRIYQMLK